MDFADRVRAALDPLLEPAGFARGQGDGADDGVIYCAAHDEFSARFPALPQAYEDGDEEWACTDLVLDFGERFTARLEGLSLRETFHALQLHGDAAEAASWEEATREEALEQLPRLLTRLLEAGASGARGA
ncbi:hypothetical protein [Aeromicrobium sp. HA]|uniref:hypothetical protein n=1 Tax=unclassified Aeromicrobium TaxID=2633570 RepID=UPI0022B04B94|nr:hypothetical protein [Aeromicrobium sp. HA]